MLHYSTTPDGVQRFLTKCARSAHPHTPADYTAELALLDELDLSGEASEMEFAPGEIAALELELLARELDELDTPQPARAEPATDLDQLADLADLDFGEWLLEPAEKAALEALALNKIGGVSSAENAADRQDNKGSGVCGAGACVVSTSSPSAITLSASPSATPSSTPARRSTWRTLTAQQTYLEAVRRAAALDGLAVTLNLSREIEAETRTHTDPLRYLSQRLNDALRASKLPSLPFALALEVSDAGKLHLHGVIIPGESDPVALKRALMKAGGRMDGRTASRQLMLKPINDADGWAGYCLKDAKKTARALSGKRLVALSQPMTRLAKDHYEAALPPKKARKPRVVSQPAPALPAAHPSRDLRRAPLRVRQARQDTRARLPQVQRPRLKGGNVVREQRQPRDLAQLALDPRPYVDRQRSQHRLDPLPQHLRLIIGRAGQDRALRGRDRESGHGPPTPKV